MLKLSSFHGQSYSDANGEWPVKTLYDWAVKNVPLSDLPVKELADAELRPSDTRADEPIGSPEFIERAERSNLDYPILVVIYHNDLNIADGLHRLWKARSLGHSTIKGYVIPHTVLPNIKEV